jgi:ketosteroid isomerase-like protein
VTSNPEANAALVTESFEAFNSGDTERLLAVVAPDLVMHFAELPAPLHGGRSGSKDSS